MRTTREIRTMCTTVRTVMPVINDKRGLTMIIRRRCAPQSVAKGCGVTVRVKAQMDEGESGVRTSWVKGDRRMHRDDFGTFFSHPTAAGINATAVSPHAEYRTETNSYHS